VVASGWRWAVGACFGSRRPSQHKICCAKHKNQTENDMKMWQERNRRQTSSPSEIPAEYYKQAKVYGKANVGN